MTRLRHADGQAASARQARAATLPSLLIKESRALMPVWLVCLGAVLGGALVGTLAPRTFSMLDVALHSLRGLGTAAYFLGGTALAALSIGHEYLHGTLPSLLSQPAPRRLLLLAKLSVLSAMLLVLFAVATAVLFNPSTSGRSLPQLEYAMPVLALCVAPWLTMLSRNPIAGTVFTVGIAGGLLVAGDVLGEAIYQGVAREVETFRVAFFWIGTLVVCAVAAVAGLRTFMRLEAVDGRDPDVSLPSWSWMRARLPRRAKTGHPVWLLIKKELHLQQMTFAVAGYSMLVWIILVSSSLVPDWTEGVLTLLTFLGAFLTAMLIGSLASAEERRLGTLEWQMMLPISASKQWIVKVAMVMALTAVVSVGLPALLHWIMPLMYLGIPRRPEIVQLLFAVSLVVCTAGALYVSSLCTSGIQALLISTAVTPAVALFLQTVAAPLGQEVFGWASRRTAGFTRPVSIAGLEVETALALLLGAGVVAVVLRMALANHRSADRSGGRVIKQVMSIGVCLLVGVALWAVVVASLR